MGIIGRLVRGITSGLQGPGRRTPRGRHGETDRQPPRISADWLRSIRSVGGPSEISGGKFRVSYTTLIC
jgi:hypothetical protein